MDKLLTKDVKAVLFDLDNTLLASNEFVLRNINNAINRLKSENSDIPQPKDDQIIRVLANNLLFEGIFQNLFQDKWELVIANYREFAPYENYGATDGAVHAISKLSELGIVIVAMTNRIKMIENRLKQAGFDPNEFFCICTPPSSEFAKPHPRSLDDALSKLASISIYPNQIISFGDHTDDYYASKYNDIKFVAVLQGYTSKEDFLHVGLHESLIAENLEDVEGIIYNVVRSHQYKNSLKQISALDGRHSIVGKRLRHYFSEYALHKYRVKAEVEHIIALSEHFNGEIIRQLSEYEKKLLRCLYENFSEHHAFEVLQYDHLKRNGIGPTEHDVKSCELWIREKLHGTTMDDIIPCVHMFVTSEDINNLAYKSMLADGTNEVFLPAVDKIMNRLHELAQNHLKDPVMSRTHMQPASPTTFGKIFAGYVVRLLDGVEQLYDMKLKGKINGAVGNYNAFKAAYPDFDWIAYSEVLARRMGFAVDLWTDQRGSHADVIKTFHVFQEIGNVIRDLSTDLSLYTALKTIYFTKVESHVGSSVMPHKINPWFAEVAEGNIKKANYLINCFANEMDVSRLQRDLSDHDYERSYGEAIGYILVAIDHLQIALDLIRPDVEYAKMELNDNPQIVTEAIQTILRKHKIGEAYDLLKNAFRGEKPTIIAMQKFISELNADEMIKQELLAVINPAEYTGLASILAQKALQKHESYRSRIKGDCLKI
ncbi:MAG: lyase family protein [bacterium]